jgi:hypothetical protein
MPNLRKPALYALAYVRVYVRVFSPVSTAPRCETVHLCNLADAGENKIPLPLTVGSNRSKRFSTPSAR